MSDPQTRGPLDVTLLIGVEVLRRGVEALLEQIPQARVVVSAGPPLAWPDRDVPTSRVVIVAFDQWHLLAGDERMAGPDRPRVLVLGDHVHSKDISHHNDLPCDGVMSVADLTVPTLRDVLSRVVAGQLPMPAVLARQLLAASRSRLHRSVGQPLALTRREHETLGLLAQGFSNKQIAKTLGISTHGVKRLVGTVLLKLGAANRTTAVITALNEGLV